MKQVLFGLLIGLVLAMAAGVWGVGAYAKRPRGE